MPTGRENIMSRMIRGSGESGDGITLLVVEPSALARNSLFRLLKRHCAEVLLAADRPEAEAILASRRPTHLLCTSAFTALVARWRVSYGLVRVVALSGRFVAVPQAAGIDQVLEKPLAPDSLIHALSCSHPERLYHGN